jgi:hypothetical protein
VTCSLGQLPGEVAWVGVILGVAWCAGLVRHTTPAGSAGDAGAL